MASKDIIQPQGNQPEFPKHPCPLCGRDLNTLKALRNHLQSSHQNRLMCPLCTDFFEHPGSLYGHLQSEHCAHAASEPNEQQPPLTHLLSTLPPLQPSIYTLHTIPNIHAYASHPQQSKMWHRYQQAEGKPSETYVFKCPLTSIANNALHYTNSPLRFSYIPAREQDLLWRYLVSKCHSEQRLALQGFTIPSPQPSTIPNRGPLFYTNPRLLPATPKRRAIVIDCEMIQTLTNPSHPAFLSAVDFFTGEVLINNYTAPTSPVTNWQTPVSGIAPANMSSAIASLQAFRSPGHARNTLWQFVDQNTVLIGHALHNDLRALQAMHLRVVDTAIITAQEVFPEVGLDRALGRLFKLRELALEIAGTQIQCGLLGHDALEDGLATREVLVRYLQEPGVVRLWAERARAGLRGD